MHLDLSALRRHPDIDEPGLEASDAADRLLLDEAAAVLAALRDPGEIVVVDDSFGALALGATAAGGRSIRVHQDTVTGERALAENAGRTGFTGDLAPQSLPLDAALFAGAKLVLMRLPRSLDRLDEVVALAAANAEPDVVIMAAGRIKHMSRNMNEVLAGYFERVDVSHARQKSRVLTASIRRTAPSETSGLPREPWPHRQHDADLDLDVVAHGGVFAGTGIDIGTRFLIANLGNAVPDAVTAVDLACGSGVIGAWLARERPALVVRATDRSAVAAASARLTAVANGVAERMSVVQADGLEGVADASERLIVVNPPFHSDAAVHTGIAAHLFAEAARVLEPGGELWCVWNTPLGYRAVLERTVGPTRRVARNEKFTVTASTRGVH